MHDSVNLMCSDYLRKATLLLFMSMMLNHEESINTFLRSVLLQDPTLLSYTVVDTELFLKIIYVAQLYTIIECDYLHIVVYYIVSIC